ncbi:hypothetical protein NC651_000887 [Populus alba x Populus x berolinensis]|nr:hypothetical protein NC651_000887 [Populus alba x Populus x berolinensis]
MGFGLPWLGFLDLTWVLQDLGPLIFYNRWVLHDLVLNKCGCTRLPAGYVGGYCSGSIGLDVFGLWEISWLLDLRSVYFLFHFIGLVAAAVLGFVRVPMLSRLVVYGLSMSFSLLAFLGLLLVACFWFFVSNCTRILVLLCLC